MGHTEHIAWSITLNFLDLEDLFVVELTRNKMYYKYDGQEYPLNIQIDTISLRVGWDRDIDNP